MATPSVTSCCFEISVNVCNNRYLAELRVDGLLKEQIEFQTEDQLSNWADTIHCTADRDLYVRVQNRKACHRHIALALAEKLSRQGMMIGISRQSSVCRSKGRRLQLPCAGDVVSTAAES